MADRVFDRLREVIADAGPPDPDQPPGGDGVRTTLSVVGPDGQEVEADFETVAARLRALSSAGARRERAMSGVADLEDRPGVADGPAAREREAVEDADGGAADLLRSYVERINRLEEEKKALSEDIKGIFTEAVGRGFNKQALAGVAKLARMDSEQREKAEDVEAQFDLYKRRLGL